MVHDEHDDSMNTKNLQGSIVNIVSSCPSCCYVVSWKHSGYGSQHFYLTVTRAQSQPSRPLAVIALTAIAQPEPTLVRVAVGVLTRS